MTQPSSNINLHRMYTSIPSIALMALGAILSGVIGGAITSAVGSVLYLVLVLPTICGITCGVAVGRIARHQHVRSTNITSVVGAIGAIIAIITILAAAWSIRRSEIVTELTTKLGGSDALVERALELWNRDEAGGASDFMAPLMYRLNTGIELFDEQTLNLGFGFNLTLLILETGLAIYAAIRFANDPITDPYCSRCKMWTSRRIVGTASLGALATIKSELKLEQWHRLGRRLGSPKVGSAVTLKCYMCDTCEEATVRFELDVAESGRRIRTLLKKEAPYSALQDIWDSQQMAKGDI